MPCSKGSKLTTWGSDGEQLGGSVWPASNMGLSVDLSEEQWNWSVSEPGDTAVPGAVGSSLSGKSWAAL